MLVIYKVNKIVALMALFLCIFAGVSSAQKITIAKVEQASDGSISTITYDSVITQKSTQPATKTAMRTMAAAEASSCTCTCLKPLFDYLIASHRLFIPATDNILVSTLVQDANTAGYAVDHRICNVLNDNINKTFFALTTKTVSNVYKARIGDCVVSLKTSGNENVDLYGLVGDACTGAGSVSYHGGNIAHVSFPATEAMTQYYISYRGKVIFTDPFFTASPSIIKDTLTKKLISGYQRKLKPGSDSVAYYIQTYFRFSGVNELIGNPDLQSAVLKLYAYPEGFMSPAVTDAHTPISQSQVNSIQLFSTIQQWDYSLNSMGGSFTAAGNDYSKPANAPFEDVTFNVLPYFTLWKTFNRNTGFILWYKESPDTLPSRATFCSQRYDDPSKRPALEVTYVTSTNTNIQAQLQVDSCYSCTMVSSGICYSAVTDTSVNPYVYSLAGNWRPYKAYTYYDTRVAPAFLAKTDIRNEGKAGSFTPFWGIRNDNVMAPQYDEAKWVWNTESTLFNRKGFELENKDPLGRYNAGLYGYDQALPVAVTQNSRYRESAFEGFEDYFFEPAVCDNVCASGRNFDFSQYKESLDTQQKHTGKYSLRVATGTSIGISAPLVESENGTYGLSFNTASNDCGAGGKVLKSIRATADALLPVFSPLTNKQVLVSAWVKEAQDCHCQSYANSQIGIVVEKASGNLSFIAKPSGNIIEGWQRIEQVVEVPAGATRISINLQSTGNATVYYDDVRIHPYNANMRSFVYNPVNLRLMAELDENNYATFYEYDDDGTLIRLKKETERGIKTIKETRSALLKEDQ